VKTFFFRLERLLQLRARNERERARRLGEALREEQEQRDVLAAAAANLGQCGQQIAEATGKVASAGMILNLGLAMDAAVNQVEAAEVSHRAAAESVVSEQEQFGRARMERRVIERLRERREDAWRTAAAREEQCEQDGLAHHRRYRRGDPS